MYTSEGLFCFVEELSTLNEFELYKLIQDNKLEYQFKISDTQIPEDFFDFKKMLLQWFCNGRNYQFLVRKKDNNVCGTVFLYGYSDIDKTVKISFYFDPLNRRKKLTLEALFLVVLFCVQVLRIEKIYFSVYRENVAMLKILEKIKAKKINETNSLVNEERIIINFELDYNLFLEKGLKFQKR